MAENDFLPFAAAAGANVLDQIDYAAASATATGFVSGLASSAAVNKTLRQASIMAAVIAKFIVDETSADVIDDGTLDTIISNFILAIRAANPASAGTVTGVTGTLPITSSGGTAPAIGINAATETTAGSMSAADKTKLDGIATGATANTGTVTAVSIAAANNGVTATVTNGTTTAALTLGLGAITPSSVNTAGSVIATGGFQKGSSRKIKTGLRRIGYGLADLLKIETRRGRYKKRVAKDGRAHLFVIAEQLQGVIPEAVYEHEDSTPTVDYTELVPVLIAAVQELAGKVRKLEASRNG